MDRHYCLPLFFALAFGAAPDSKQQIKPMEKAMAQTATESILSLNGINLAYSDVGVGQRTVLLIHGHPFDRTMWQPQIDFLKSRHRVLVPDLRGYGSSSLPGNSRETKLETFAADNLALIDALGITTFILGGLSMGGQIVLEMFRQAPHRIDAQLLADTFAGFDSPERKQLRFTTAGRLERDGMASYAREELTKMIMPANAEQLPDVAAHVTKMMTSAPPSGAAAALRGRAQRIDYLPLLGQIRVPTLIVVGREDEYTPVALAEQLHNGIAGSKLAIMEGAGHMPNLERPDAFNQVLSSWLQSL